MTIFRWLVVALLVMPGLASAQGVVRVADYPSFGRVVFEFAVPTAFEVVEEADRLLIVFDGAPSVGAALRLPRNVRAIQGGAGSATLVLAPGARFRSFRERSRVGIDVLDPLPNRGARSGIRPGQAPVAGTLPNPMVEQTPSIKLDQPAINVEAPLPAPVVPVSHDTLPEPSPTPSVATPVAPRPASVLLPFEPGVGAATFHRAGAGLAVFDQRMPLDLALLGGTALAGATVQLGQAVTVLTVALQPNQALALSREPKGWRVTVNANDVPAASLTAEARPAELLLKLDNPGQVVTILDPSTGLALLVGTVNPVSGAGPAMSPARRTPGYALLPTWLGVAVEPLSDMVELRVAADGFVLASPGIPSADTAPAPPTGEVFSRRFDLPDLPLPALLQRLKAQVAAAAAAPPRARTTDRMAAARSLLSLGLATEAQALLALIATEDPAAAADANVTGLLAIAALLAGRSPEAGGLDDPRLDGSDDIILWRGLRDAMRDTDPEAGRGLARLLPLANVYPTAIRNRLRPFVVESAVAFGQAASVASALDKLDDATLGFARALQSERSGDTPAALLAFDALAAGRDQLTQVRAGVRAAELRLRDSLLTPAQAADALERYAAIWRGDARESRIRLRVAELRTAAGAFRPALEMLRDTERLFPELQPAIRAAMATVFQAMVAQPQVVPAIEFITVASDYAGLLPNSVGNGISTLLADKLSALDLPGRAGPMLATLAANTPAGPARATIGTRLAQMQLEDEAYSAVVATLDASDASELPPAMVEQRTLLRASANAARGDIPNAITGLVALGTAGADDLRATLLSQAADWKGSSMALAELAAKIIPANGPLSEAMQDIVLRQATSAMQANDTALLAELRHRYGTRLGGARADLFHLLAAGPLRSPSDLPRTATELALARQLPNRLQTLSAQNSR